MARGRPDEVVPLTIALSLAMSGLACAEYGSAEEAVVNQALASHLDGVDEGGFASHVCSDEASSRRRGRALKGASDAISIYTEVVTMETWRHVRRVVTGEFCIQSPEEFISLHNAQ